MSRTVDRLGATHLGEGRYRFVVWAPSAERVDLHVLAPRDALVPMAPGGCGYRSVELYLGTPPEAVRYRYRLDGGEELADPASAWQPDGVHGASGVVDTAAFRWTDDGWRGRRLDELVLYELHVGTFSERGTFEGAVPHLDGLAELGVTAVEIMPVAEFPGGRNWGYDGVFPYAVQSTYGGPGGLARLVDACHARGLAVVLDVVYNHLGPEGNVLPRFGPYLTDRYRTPWGRAVNVDGRGSDEVRRFMVEHALRFLEEFHVDALRLDAIDGIVDTSASPFLAELSAAVDALAARVGRPLLLIAETTLNDPRVVTPRERGGLGVHAQWSDDFHHAVHALLTGERTGYYADFGEVAHVATAYREGFVLTGQHSAYRGHRVGAPSRSIPADRLVVCCQNHDQVGNRAGGERLSTILAFEELKLLATSLLLSPRVPLLFMGEEYAETNPFPYFVSHTDPDLVEAVRAGRREEFASFAWGADPPDPQDERTFRAARLDRRAAAAGPGAAMLRFHAELLRLRRADPALRRLSREHLEVTCDPAGGLALRRWAGDHEALVAMNFGREARTVAAPARPGPPWRRALDSADPAWDGPGSGLPDVLERADGAVCLPMPGSAAAVYLRDHAGGGVGGP